MTRLWIRWFPRDRGFGLVVPFAEWAWATISDSEGVFVRILGLEVFWRRS